MKFDENNIRYIIKPCSRESFGLPTGPLVASISKNRSSSGFLIVNTEEMFLPFFSLPYYHHDNSIIHSFCNCPKSHRNIKYVLFTFLNKDTPFILDDALCVSQKSKAAYLIVLRPPLHSSPHKMFKADSVEIDIFSKNRTPYTANR